MQVRAWESDGESVGVVGELAISIEMVLPDGLHAATALRNTMGSAIELRRGSASVSVRVNDPRS
ncbi:hypothetical protein [Endozoicomonas atrinae]|uniref:hypothetical protein n=1 Tax=Endozoicomonas atrinae TaxID=1333660 RepID=UPI001112D98B|nr:hypothetical protein [Endozoicomonas atrinae]